MAISKGNIKNLVPQNMRTKEEQRAIARKGGQAAAATYRRRKALKTILRETLSLKLSELEDKEIRDLFFAAAGSKNSDRTIAEVVMVNFILACARGSSQMMKMLLELVGEDPNLVLRSQELALKKALAKAAEKQGLEASSAMQQLVESLRGDE